MSFFVIVNTAFNRQNYPQLIGTVINTAPSYVMVKKIQPYRKHNCWKCNHEWIAPVILTNQTTNISGEQTEYCPNCFAASSCSSAWINHDGTNWEHEPIPTDKEMEEINQRMKEMGLL